MSPPGAALSSTPGNEQARNTDKMWTTAAFVAALASSVYGAAVPAPDADGRYTISAPGITAKVGLPADGSGAKLEG